MADTQAVIDRISTDTPARYRLTDAAVERLKQRLGVDEIEDLADRLGFSRQTFWRLRKGEYDIRLSRARYVASVAGMTVQQVFEAVARG
jgi:DNA-binding XRE family transcriptional regulator